MSAVATRQMGMLASPFADCREPVTEGHTVLSMFSEEALLTYPLTYLVFTKNRHRVLNF